MNAVAPQACRHCASDDLVGALSCNALFRFRIPHSVF